MPAPRHEIADLLDVDVPPGGTVITVSDLHLPPGRTDVSGRSCETLARRLNEHPGPLPVAGAWAKRRIAKREAAIANPT